MSKAGLADEQGAQLNCEVYFIQMHFPWGRNEVVHMAEAWEGYRMLTSPTPPQALASTPASTLHEILGWRRVTVGIKCQQDGSRMVREMGLEGTESIN